jgi:hypothetical protein
MKKQLSFTILTIVLLAAVLISLSCNGTQTTNNATTTVNNTSVQSNAEQSALTKPPDCSGNLDEKRQKVREGVGKNINGNKFVEFQFRNKFFHFDPVIDHDNGKIDLYIWGKFFITKPGDFQLFDGTFKSYFARGCVERIVFRTAPVSGPTPTSNQRPAILSDGFEFIACEHPKVICDDGVCKDPKECSGSYPDPFIPNVNTNSNANVNSNTKTNANK